MTRLQQTVSPHCAWLLLVLLWAPVARGQNVIYDVNNALLNIIQNTSASLIDGPPEVANEIALVDGAMFDAVNASTGLTYAPFRYAGGAVAGSNPNAAALQAALTVMNNLYVNPATSVYQQFQGLTGATYFSTDILATHPGYANDIVGPTLTQMQAVVASVNSIQSQLNALPVDSTTTAGIAVGTAAADAAIATNDKSGSQAAMLATLTPFAPPNPGDPGIYVPPDGRPALQPTWGSVTPLGIDRSSLTTIEQSLPGPQPLTSPGYALQVLQTECEGSGTALPAQIEGVCAAAGFPPESAAEAQAALFWNDPGGTLQPPGHWLQIADTVTSELNLDLLKTVRATALAGIAMNDAGIGTWDIKYQDSLWRPFTAIQGCSGWSPNFNTCDPGWSSLIATPPHPDYIAGHPAFSGAAATAIVAAIGRDAVTFTSTSDAYCNVGTAISDSLGNITSCTFNGTTFSISTAGCANGGTPQFDSEGAIVGCLLNGVPQTVSGGDCNNAGSVAVLNPDGSANALYNNSALICPIALTYDSIIEASGGFLGAAFSRVVGGIHTPDAVGDALALGDTVGTVVAAENLAVPEPPGIPTLATSLLLLGVLRHRRSFLTRSL